MVGVDTYIVILQVKGILAELDMLEFILVEVRPAPQPCINHMRKTFPPCHLRREHSIITSVRITVLLTLSFIHQWTVSFKIFCELSDVYQLSV